MNRSIVRRRLKKLLYTSSPTLFFSSSKCRQSKGDHSAGNGPIAAFCFLLQVSPLLKNERELCVCVIERLLGSLCACHPLRERNL